MEMPQFFSNPLVDYTQAVQLQNALMQQQQQQRQYQDTLESRAGYEAAARAAQQQQQPGYQIPTMFRQQYEDTPEAKAYAAAQAANALAPPIGTSVGGFTPNGAAPPTAAPSEDGAFQLRMYRPEQTANALAPPIGSSVDGLTLKGTEDQRGAEMNQLKAAADAKREQLQQPPQQFPSSMSQQGFQMPEDASYSYMQGAQAYQQQLQEQQTNFYNNRVLPIYNAWVTTKDENVKKQLVNAVDKHRGDPAARLAVQFVDAIKGVNLTPGGTIAAGSIMTEGLKNMLLAGTPNLVMRELINGLPIGQRIPFDLTVDMRTGNVISSEASKGGKGSTTPGGVAGLRVENEAKRLVAAGEFQNVEDARPQAAENLNDKKEARQFNMMMARQAAADARFERQLNLREYNSSVAPARAAYAQAARFSVAAGGFEEKIHNNVKLIREFMADYKKTHPWVASRPGALLNDILSGKVIGDGKYKNIQLVANSIGTELGKLESNSFGSAGATKHATEAFNKLKATNNWKDFDQQLTGIERMSTTARKAQDKATADAVNAYNLVRNQYGLPNIMTEKAQRDMSYKPGGTFKIPGSETMKILGVNRDDMTGEATQLYLQGKSGRYIYSIADDAWTKAK